MNRIRRTSAYATLVTVALSVAGCSESPLGPSEPITELPRSLSASEAALVAAGNGFAVDLLRQVHEADPGSTVFLSPLSASVALGMTLNGAVGETATQMQDMLGFAGMSQGDINASYRDLIALLSDLDPRVQLGIGNAIFHRSGFAIEQLFLDTTSEYFDARVEGLDFDAPSAVQTINGWVADATENRIEQIVSPPIDPMTMVFLINAIYFKGDWTVEFDGDDSYDGPFHLAGGGTETARFMTKDDTVAYRSDDAWLAADLPYGGGAWAMTVAVPRDGSDVADVLDDLASLLDPGAEWTTGEVEIHLPRFELEWEKLLNDDLRALGMTDAFSPSEADFTPMYAAALQEQLHVQRVKQKTFLRVDEVGTEAAAVTSVEVGTTSCCTGPPVLRADRPFFLAIRERLSGTVLFAGVVVETPENAS